ncbi:hypothetical protein FACS1894171_2000 [Clostridia bacterium]|nr:hypothetical protein FACS1894171_2000 [Clostridia bacterium]
MGFFDKLKQGLDKTRKAVTGQIEDIFKGFAKLDDEFYDELEEALILADMGVQPASEAVELLRERAKKKGLKDAGAVREELKEILVEMLGDSGGEFNFETQPSVLLVIGVNGVGKTTTIGKLASVYTQKGKRVLLCAADTFRAAAADQLEIWAKRAGVGIVRQNEGADPAAVVFDAITAAKARGVDILICDTAGRLHNKQNLINELAKISRIIGRELPGSSCETLLVIDATTGQNGLTQASVFKDAAGVSSVALTKLDGTAKGGIVIAVSKTLGLPVKYIGIGEGVEDLVPFDARAFVEAII